MGKRGVSRPVMKQHGHNDMAITAEQRAQMLHMHHAQTLWIYWLIIILGCWVILSPLTFDYLKNAVQPSGGRQVWLHLQARATVMKWSDIITGIVIVILGYRSLTPNRPVSIWLCCGAGVWLSMAPLVFWCPSAVGYLNDTLVGALIIALTVLIPGMPNMIMYMEMGPDQPPGWSYNPSSWPQRWIMIVTGFLGWIVSRYLAAYQLGYLADPYDPFFGNSTVHVLNSAMSQSLPVSDAGLGSFAYTFEFLMGWMGSSARWRTMPWMVTFFGILVIPLGLVHIFLVISQPLTVGYWCTFCLLAAAIMLPMIPLEVDEVIAMVQFMIIKKKQGHSFWKIFWKGGGIDNGTMDKRSPDIGHFPKARGPVFIASLWGMSFPWTLVLSMCIGIALMFSPAVFGVTIKTPPAMLHHLLGALMVVVAVISMGEVLRAGRYLNLLLGLALAVLVWVVKDVPVGMAVSSTLAGLIIMLLALPRGVIKQQFGSWDKYIV